MRKRDAMTVEPKGVHQCGLSQRRIKIQSAIESKLLRDHTVSFDIKAELLAKILPMNCSRRDVHVSSSDRIKRCRVDKLMAQ